MLFQRIKDIWAIILGTPYNIEWSEFKSASCATQNDVLYRAHSLGMHSTINMQCNDCYKQMLNDYIDICKHIMQTTIFENQIDKLTRAIHLTFDGTKNWSIFNTHPVYFITTFLEIETK